MAMGAGDLRHRVTFQEPTGQSASGYADVLTSIPARIVVVNGSEAMRFGAQTSSQIFKVTVRYASGVLPEWRMVDEGGSSYQILTSGDPTGERQWLDIFATGLQ